MAKLTTSGLLQGPLPRALPGRLFLVWKKMLCYMQLTFSCRQLVLKPKPYNTKFNRGSLRINGLLSHMPRLRELNIHVGVPLFGILREEALPTVKTLSVPINQYGPVYDVTSIIRACPNVLLLRMNVNGEPEPIWTGGRSELSHSKCRRALEAAAALGSLQALEMFKSASLYESLEVDIPAGTYMLGDFDPYGWGNGWVPEDLKGLYKAPKT